MAFTQKSVLLSTVDQDIFVCPAMNSGSIHGLVFSNVTGGNRTVTIKRYSQADGQTTVIATNRAVNGNSEFTWPKPINLSAGDKIIASADVSSSVVAVASIYLGTSVPAAAGLTPRGGYSAVATYLPNDLVVSAGTSYVALNGNTNSPPPSVDWMVMASKGDTGAAGLSVSVSDEGVQKAATTAAMNFTGLGVTVTSTGNNVTVNIPGVVADLGYTPADVVALNAHTVRTDNPHAVTKAQVGLSNADNTSDANKPISIATQTALNLKADITAMNSAIATAKAEIVNSSPAALDTLNELAAALGNDANYAATTAAALGYRVRFDISDQALTIGQQSNARINIGMGNVDNTSDANKPISTATQAALNGKEAAYAIGSNGQYYKWDKTWGDLATDVRGVVLTGLVLTTGGAIAAADTQLVAFGKLQKQITDNAAAAITATGNATLTNKTLTTPTIDGYTEGYITSSGTSFSPNITTDTVFGYATTGNASITLPTPSAGKSFEIHFTYGGAHTLSFTVSGGTALLWDGGSPPTFSPANTKTDIIAVRATRLTGTVQWVATKIMGGF